jgi:hypothetical protein
VDVAKGAWIFDVQGNKQVSPVLLYMIQAGVPFEMAVNFVSNPLVLNYVAEQQKNVSPASRIFYRLQGKTSILPQDIRMARTNARLNILQSIGALEEIEEDYAFAGSDAIMDYIQKQVTEKKVAKMFTEDKLQDMVEGETNSEYNKLAFLHYLELEEHAQSLKKMKTTLVYDTTKSTDLFQAAMTIAKTEALMEDQIIPTKVVKDILNETPIGSFNIADFQLKLYKPMFPLRLHDAVNEHLISMLSSKNRQDKMKSLFGTEEKYIRKWRNDLVTYVFTNAFRKSNALLTDYKGIKFSSLKDSVIAKDYLQQGVVVKDVDGEPTIFIDRQTLENQFRNKLYTYKPETTTYVQGLFKQFGSYQSMGLSPISSAAFMTASGLSFDEFVKFSIERELLRWQYKPSDVQNDEDYKQIVKSLKKSRKKLSSKEIISQAYEEWLRNKALDNIFNIWKMFNGASPKTFLRQFKEIVKKHPHLEQEYSVVADLVDDVIKTKSVTYENIKLRDTQLTKDMINAYHENLVRLADPTIEKVKNEAENKRISEFFGRLPMFAFFQTGLDTTNPLSLSRIIPYDKLVPLLEASTKEAVKALNEGSDMLTLYTKIFDKANNPKFNAVKRRRVVDLYSEESYIGFMEAEELLSPTSKEGVFKASLFDIERTTGDIESFIDDVSSEYVVVLEGPIEENSVMYPKRNRRGKVVDESIELDKLLKGSDVFKLNTHYTESMRGGVTTDNVDQTIELIKESLDELEKYASESGKKIIFLTDGYSQSLINSKKALKVKQVFDTLSKELFDRFGYVNANSTYSNKMVATILGKDKLKTRATVLEKDLRKEINKDIDAVIEQIDKCRKK